MPAKPVARVGQTTKENRIWAIDFRRQIAQGVAITSFAVNRIKRNTEDAPVSIGGSMSGTIILFQTGVLTESIYDFEVVITLSNGEEKESNMVLEVTGVRDLAGKATQTEKEDLFWGLDFSSTIPQGESISSFAVTRYLAGVPTDVTSASSQDGTAIIWSTGLLTEENYIFEVVVTLSNSEVMSSAIQITVVP